MDEFEKIMKEMKKRGIIPKVHYELMALRALKTVAIILVVIGVIWMIWK